MTNEEMTACVLAHRFMLMYLLMILRQAVPNEASMAEADATATMLQNSVAMFLARYPPELARSIQAVADREIDGIILTPLRDLPHRSDP